MQVQSSGSIPCNLCSASEAVELARRDRDGNPLRTVICRRCGLVWTDPRPTEAEVKKFYAQDYRVQYKGAYQPKLKHVYRAGRVALDRFESLREFLQPGYTVLDVGAGGGELVFLLRHLGWDARGLEPNEGYAHYARTELGLPMEIGFFKELESGLERFDVVTLYHVLEHLEDPLGTIVKLRRVIKPDGHLVIEVPNVEATCQAPGHRFHFAHLYNFNPATLEALARKAGYEVLRTTVSADGGNVGVFLRRLPETPAKDGEIPGNYERVMGIIRRHTALGHYLSARPYARLIGRAKQAVAERRAVKQGGGRKEMLAAVFGEKSRASGER